MASFASSPAPRRRYNNSGSGTGSSPRASSPFGSGGARSRQAVAGGSRRASRLGTPRFSGTGNGNADVSYEETSANGSVMDVDQSSVHTTTTNVREKQAKPPIIFAQSDELSAFFYTSLPVEVKQTVRNADFYREPWHGGIDSATGFALVTSYQTCFVWQHTQALTGAPTCYIFPCPPSDLFTPPLHALVPLGAAREPGLILLATQGEVRYWNSIANGLAGGQNFTTIIIPLAAEEYITVIQRSDAQTYVVATSMGNLFRLNLVSSGGKTIPVAHPFARARRSSGFSRFLLSWSASSDSTTGADGREKLAQENIPALTLGALDDDYSRDVWVLMATRVQRWRFLADGSEQLVSDEFVDETISRAVKVAFVTAPRDDGALDLELLDLVVTSGEELLLLVSYAGIEDDLVDRNAHPRRIYVTVRLSVQETVPDVLAVGPVPYQSPSTSLAAVHPRLKLIPGTSVVAIQFGDAVTLCSTASNYQDRLALKTPTDRILGMGIAGVGDASVDGELLVFTSGTMMRAVLDAGKISKFDAATGHAKLIKSTMTQSILYGPSYINPLRFSLPPEVDEDDLMNGAEDLSRSVLESDSNIVTPSPELTSQMKERKNLLAYLMHFINENGALSKMSQRSRQRLLTDAEKLYSALDLWTKYEELPTEGTILSEAIRGFMDEAKDFEHEDLIRAFFRLRVAELGQLLPYVTLLIRQAAEEAPESLLDYLGEANVIALTILNSARSYRGHNASVYGVQLPMIKPWTSRPSVIDLVLELFNTTAMVVETPTDMDGGARGKKEQPLSQLPELASLLFACIKERLDWLNSPLAGGEQQVLRDRQDLEARFTQLRPEVLDTLRRNTHGNRAFKLAEDYRDFSSLASLCNKDRVYPPAANPNVARLNGYVEKYQYQFAKELYGWYIEHGEVRAMFAHDMKIHQPHLDRFFKEHPDLELAWIHQLGTYNYGDAATSLLREAGDAEELTEKHLMLSIGKLAKLAEIAPNTRDEPSLDPFLDQLDFVAVHDALVRDLQADVEPPNRGKPSIDALAGAITQAKARSLEDKPTFVLLYRQLVRALLQGKALPMEDVLDLLTLQDNGGENGLENYVVALDLLAHTTELPEARLRTARAGVWRRIYIHDDWIALGKTAGLTDAALNDRLRGTALYHVVMNATRDPRFTRLNVLQADASPSAAEIESRYPGMSAEQVEGLLEDYRSECMTLATYSVTNVYDRTIALVLEDFQRLG